MIAETVEVEDVAGKSIEVGDTVVTVNGQTTGRVCEITREDDDTAFVAIRPVYHSYGKGVWYAADQVFWVARPNAAKKTTPPAKAKPGSDAQASAASKPGAKSASAGRSPGPAVARSTPAKKK